MMSAYGPKRTWSVALQMSAFGGKADIKQKLIDDWTDWVFGVSAFGGKADMAFRTAHF